MAHGALGSVEEFVYAYAHFPVAKIIHLAQYDPHRIGKKGARVMSASDEMAMDRQQQIDLMKDAEERTVGHFSRWIRHPEVKAALQAAPEDDGFRHEVRRVRVAS